MAQPAGRIPNSTPWPWRVAQVAGVAALVVLLAGLVLRPERSLTLLWNVVIPLLPASFFLSPALWRAVCPLATLNLAGNGLAGRRRLTRDLLPVAAVAGLTLLAVLVPARRFLFNNHGPALAALIGGVAVMALVMGTAWDVKAGFCNLLCPVLPVERLYGQRPLINIENPRCLPCSRCTSRACIDLDPERSLLLSIQRADRRPGKLNWLLTPYGIFAAAFPGFVAGYGTLQDGGPGTAGHVFAHMALYAAAGFLATVLVVWVLNLAAPRALLFSAAAAGGLYYWFTAVPMSRTLGLGHVGVDAIRAAGLVLVGVWLHAATGRNSGRTERRKA
ncbi:MAG: hypothetical protein AB7I33_06510 [Gemmatimonadales bacterium]